MTQRYALIGLPGSGKSTFATKLGAALGIPVHHLDKHMFEPNGKKKDKNEFLAIQTVLVQEKSWIIEGCSFSTFELRFAHADTLIYFRYSRLLCIWRAIKRIFTYEPAFGGLRRITGELLRYIWTFDKEKRGRIEELRKKYPDVNFLIFSSPRDADTYLTHLCRERNGNN